MPVLSEAEFMVITQTNEPVAGSGTSPHLWTSAGLITPVTQRAGNVDHSVIHAPTNITFTSLAGV